MVINGVTAGMPPQSSGKAASVEGISFNQHFPQRILAGIDNRPNILTEKSLLKKAGDSLGHPQGNTSEWPDLAVSRRVPHPTHLAGRTS
ncbi:MAG: hypothetical protein JW746_03590 [Candidatus Krumholzibacteriota bacterium]|nr:hypothetical protein [Candidatus Krumholzibacteriota bacterium]